MDDTEEGGVNKEEGRKSPASDSEKDDDDDDTSKRLKTLKKTLMTSSLGDLLKSVQSASAKKFTIPRKGGKTSESHLTKRPDPSP